MYAGRIVEEGPVEVVFDRPAHPYTQGLLASVISLETTELHSIDGDPPDLVEPPTGAGSGSAARTPSRRASGWTPRSIDSVAASGPPASCTTRRSRRPRRWHP